MAVEQYFWHSHTAASPGRERDARNEARHHTDYQRERLAQHRTNASCNGCHSVIDPLGFSLENFDVIGGWRTIDEAGKPVDASGTTANGEKIDGLAGLRAVLLANPDQFPRTVTENLWRTRWAAASNTTTTHGPQDRA